MNASNDGRTARKISDLKLEQYLLNELSQAQHAEIEKILSSSEVDRQALETLRASNEEDLKLYPAEDFAKKIQARALEAGSDSKSQKSSWQWGGIVTALAGAGVVLLVVQNQSTESLTTAENNPSIALLQTSNPIQNPSIEQQDSGVRLKGDPQLIIRRVGDGSSQFLKDGDRVRSGDRLQVSYRAAGHRFGSIVSIDGRGEVSVHFPDAPTQGTEDQKTDAELKDGDAVTLDHSWELDDAPAFERFFFVATSHSEDFDPVVVHKAAKELAQSLENAQSKELELPKDWRQVSILLRKEK